MPRKVMQPSIWCKLLQNYFFMLLYGWKYYRFAPTCLYHFKNGNFKKLVVRQIFWCRTVKFYWGCEKNPKKTKGEITLTKGVITR